MPAGRARQSWAPRGDAAAVSLSWPPGLRPGARWCVRAPLPAASVTLVRPPGARSPTPSPAVARGGGQCFEAKSESAGKTKQHNAKNGAARDRDSIESL